jgi:hypothetical protein
MLVGGGLISEFGSLHFEGITQAYIRAAGAIGLVVNAVITNGEGISLMVTKRAKELAAVMRGEVVDPDEPMDQPAVVGGEMT